MTEIINVGLCTFRRPMVFDTLKSLATQRLPTGFSIHVIVADNDETDAQRSPIAEMTRALHLSLTYVHAPARNISIARNACLGAATEEWLAFIDDDEVAEPDWLERLIKDRNDYDVIFGVSKAIYLPSTPRWIVDADLHSARLSGGRWNGYTGNVLLRRSYIERYKLRFSQELGQIGGEDTMFFFEAYQTGARFGYVPEAIVSELVPAARARFRWLALRKFRSGQIYHMVLKRQGRAGVGSLLALMKVVWCVLSAPVFLYRRGVRSQLIRGAMHLGVVAAGIGLAPYREYA